MNEYFRHKNTLLLNNDILEENLFDKEFIDLIVTSPPYNVGIEYNSNDDELSYEQYLVFSEKWMRNCYKWSNTQARFCLNIPLLLVASNLVNDYETMLQLHKSIEMIETLSISN